MKRILFFLVITTVIGFASCKKSETPADTSITPFTYTSLVVSDTLIKLNEFATITATATGDELSYKWTSESGFGTFIGSGASVQWSVCHADAFVISCQVTDKYNHSETKNVTIWTRQ